MNPGAICAITCWGIIVAALGAGWISCIRQGRDDDAARQARIDWQAERLAGFARTQMEIEALPIASVAE